MAGRRIACEQPRRENKEPVHRCDVFRPFSLSAQESELLGIFHQRQLPRAAGTRRLSGGLTLFQGKNAHASSVNNGSHLYSSETYPHCLKRPNTLKGLDEIAGRIQSSTLSLI
jgi:hypothetical protein